MAEATEGKFSELFEVIRDYAKREYDYQDKALQVLAGSYTFMFESEDMPDARGVIDDILGQYDYVFTTLERGNLDPLSVDAVVKVALYKEDYMEWGLNRLSKILESLYRRSRADETYADYVTDARIVIRGLERIVAGSVLEEIVEGDGA
jgi:aminopeptidase N